MANTWTDDRPGQPLQAPADSIPKVPPGLSADQPLPFHELLWENFERLCYRLAEKEGTIEGGARCGRIGQANQSIVIRALRGDGRYDIWQAKNYAQFSPADIEDAVASFVAGSWSKHAARLIVAVACGLDDEKLQKQIEAQARVLRANRIEFEVIGRDELCGRLSSYPEVVMEFFGREWTSMFFGIEDSSQPAARRPGEKTALSTIGVSAILQQPPF